MTQTNNNNIRENLQSVIKGIQDNLILETFDKYYHPDVVMFEHGDSTGRIGFDANRKYEESFAKNATIHEAKVLKVLVDGDNSLYEMYMHFTYGGNDVKKTQYSIQQWKDGKIIKEEFY